MSVERQTSLRRILRSIFLGSAVCIILAVAACGTKESASPNTEPLRIAYLPIIPDLPLFVANDQGLFKKHGLEPSLTKVAGSGNQVLETLARGNADLAYLAYSTVLEAEQQAPGSFMLLQHNVDAREYPSLYALVARPGSGIRTLGDLRGKTVGTFPGAAMLSLTKLMLTAEGIDPVKEAKIVQLAPPAQIAALQTGQVDALLALEPNGAFAVHSGAGRYVDRWPLTPRVAKTIPTGGTVILKKTFETRPDYVAKMIASMDDAIEFIRLHPRSSAAYYTKYCDVPEAVATDLPVLYFWKSSEIDRAVCQRYADLLHREGDLLRPLDVGSMYLPAK
jgi:NitT/TauT family transport system substrate-binding protein